MKPSVDWIEQDGPLALDAGDFDEIRRLAHDTFGLDLRPGKEILVSARLRRLVRGGGFRSFQEYYRHVAADRTGQALAGMIDALTTNHTAFLREPDHFTFLRDQLLPALAGSQPLEAWIAACSTGEEVWTLAMVLSEALASRRFSIVASDISNKVLRQAQSAEYSPERCQGVPGEWLTRYFVAGKGPDKTYCVTPQLRARVSFRRINLVEAFSWPRLFPLILCRNVMIYFDRQTQERLVGRLAACLEPGGYLFVGHAESLTRIEHTLEYVRPAVYRKPGRREGRWSK